MLCVLCEKPDFINMLLAKSVVGLVLEGWNYIGVGFFFHHLTAVSLRRCNLAICGFESSLTLHPPWSEVAHNVADPPSERSNGGRGDGGLESGTGPYCRLYRCVPAALWPCRTRGEAEQEVA